MVPARAPDAPVWGFADTHTHEFLNLAFDCHWPSLWGSSGVLSKVGVTVPHHEYHPTPSHSKGPEKYSTNGNRIPTSALFEYLLSFDIRDT